MATAEERMRNRQAVRDRDAKSLQERQRHLPPTTNNGRFKRNNDWSNVNMNHRDERKSQLQAQYHKSRNPSCRIKNVKDRKKNKILKARNLKKCELKQKELNRPRQHKQQNIETITSINKNETHWKYTENNDLTLCQTVERCKEEQNTDCECKQPCEPFEESEKCSTAAEMQECMGCVHGNVCGNTRIQQKQWCDVLVYKTVNKGYGVKCAHKITKGRFVVEYNGICIDKIEKEKRNGSEYMFKFKTLDAWVDGYLYSSEGAFVNHSCAPNMTAETWWVGGIPHIVFVALKDIEAGDELTIDYYKDYNVKDFACDVDGCKRH